MPDPTPSRYGPWEELRILRHRSNIRVIDLADAIGISRPHLSNLENGTRWPSDEIVLSLARALGVKPSMVARGEKVA